jgi:hypothetical protein
MGHNNGLRWDSLIKINYIFVKSSRYDQNCQKKIQLIAAVFHLYSLSSVLTLAYMDDLTGAKELIGELILGNAVKNSYVISRMLFEKLNN